VDATGTASCQGSCTTATSVAAPGNVTWAGTLGTFHISIAGGQSARALPLSQLALALRVTTGALAGDASNVTLSAKWSDVGFSGSDATTLTAISSLVGSVSVNYAGYVDSTNALFGTGTPAGKIGPVTSSSSASATGPAPPGQPFSMTETITATMGPNSTFTLEGMNLAVGVAPLSLGCPAASGQLDLSYDSYASAAGGIPPYSFSYTGTLPTGLGMNRSTGEVTGTATAPGSFSFTAQALDSSGNSGQDSVQSQCSITISPPEATVSLECPHTLDYEGEPYSSSLVATGGVPPYSFTIRSGTLPPGLSLNPVTGAITGMDMDTAGTFDFTAGVSDSSGKAPASKAAACVIVAAAPTFTMVAARGTTPQTVAVNTALSTPLAVVVTNSNTGKPAKGVTVTFEVATSPTGVFPSGSFAGGKAIVGPAPGQYNQFVLATTDDNGVAVAPTFTANTLVGAIQPQVRAIANVDANAVTFAITNTAGLPFLIKSVSGYDQTEQVLTLFPESLVAKVTDAWGNPVPNYPVIFSAPQKPAPGATFGGQPTLQVKTYANGNAVTPPPVLGNALGKPVCTANQVAGTYIIQAAVVGLSPVQPLPAPALFNMTNTPGPLANVYRIIPQNDPMVVVVAKGDVRYFAKLHTAYSTLTIEATDANDNPKADLQVVFRTTNPVGQPGATFANGSTGGLKDETETGGDGLASDGTLTANGNTGAFSVTVVVTDTSGKTLQRNFALQNIGANQAPVPNVVGMAQATATAAIQAAGLISVPTNQASASIAKGNVIAQTPGAGTVVTAGSKVNLTVSSGNQ